jgi:hypothetical protein
MVWYTKCLIPNPPTAYAYALQLQSCKHGAAREQELCSATEGVHPSTHSPKASRFSVKAVHELFDPDAVHALLSAIGSAASWRLRHRSRHRPAVHWPPRPPRPRRPASSPSVRPPRRLALRQLNGDALERELAGSVHLLECSFRPHRFGRFQFTVVRTLHYQAPSRH